MRVPTSSSSENIIAQIQKLSSQQALYQKQVSTNQRIFLPSDDPAAVGRLLAIGTEQRQIKQYQNNANIALNLSQASYTGLNALNTISQRAGEIATLGSSATSSTSNAAYAAEVNQLIEQAVQVGNTRFGSDYIYAGTALDTPPVSVTRDAGGKVTAATYAGNALQTPITLSEGAALSPRTTGDTNQGITDFVTNLIKLRDALTANDSAALDTTRTALEGSEDTLVNAISDNGAIQLRIQSNQTQQTARVTDLEKLASGEADVDMASALVKLSQTTSSYQAALSSGSKILQMSLLDYLN